MALIVVVMVISVVAGVVVVILAGVQDGVDGLKRVAIPEAYGIAMALVWIWVSRKPLLHMLKDNVPAISGRHIDSFIMIMMFVVTVAAYPVARANTDFNWQ